MGVWASIEIEMRVRLHEGLGGEEGGVIMISLGRLRRRKLKLDMRRVVDGVGERRIFIWRRRRSMRLISGGALPVRRRSIAPDTKLTLKRRRRKAGILQSGGQNMRLRSRRKMNGEDIRLNGARNTKLILKKKRGDIRTGTTLILRRTSISTRLLRMQDGMKRRGIGMKEREERISISPREAIVFLGGLMLVMASHNTFSLLGLLGTNLLIQARNHLVISHRIRVYHLWQ
jgi:hypothetical protein